MYNDEIVTLATYRLEQAEENLEEAITLFNINKYKGASNRAYYSIFHSIKSILALKQVDFKKHSSVIAYFNKEYVNKNLFPKELGKRITDSRYFREKSDYVDFYIITKEQCERQIETAKLVINATKEYLKNNF